MKIIFLDIDGVLNSFEEYTAPSRMGFEWDPSVMHRCGIQLDLHWDNVKKMNKLIEESGAKVVLSTSWRKGDDIWWSNLLQTLEHFHLLPVIIDKTPDLKLNRGDEVQAWLDQHPETTHFVVFDDINEFELTPKVLKNFIQTNFQVGVTDEDIEKARKLLAV